MHFPLPFNKPRDMWLKWKFMKKYLTLLYVMHHDILYCIPFQYNLFLSESFIFKKCLCLPTKLNSASTNGVGLTVWKALIWDYVVVTFWLRKTVPCLTSSVCHGLSRLESVSYLIRATGNQWQVWNMRLAWSDIHLEILLWLQREEFEDGSKREGFLESHGSN